MEKMPQNKVIVSDRTRQMLTGHVRFLVQKNPSAACKVKNDLMDAIRSLHQIPELFRFWRQNLFHRINITRCA